MARGRPRLVGALIVMVAACGRPPIESCRDDLRGVYTSGGDGTAPPFGSAAGRGASSVERWMVLDDGATLEAYPLFADGGQDPALEIAPRVIELERSAAGVAGTLRRRYMQQAARCDAQVAVHVTRCAGTTLELVLADPSPPLAFTPCTWPRPAASRVERWQRE